MSSVLVTTLALASLVAAAGTKDCWVSSGCVDGALFGQDLPISNTTTHRANGKDGCRHPRHRPPAWVGVPVGGGLVAFFFFCLDYSDYSASMVCIQRNLAADLATFRTTRLQVAAGVRRWLGNWSTCFWSLSASAARRKRTRSQETHGLSHAQLKAPRWNLKMRPVDKPCAVPGLGEPSRH